MTISSTDLDLPILDLPILDLSDAASPERREHFRAELARATSEWGFFYLTGHGIPTDLQQELITLAREFFALPLEQKREIETVNSPHYRGYTQVGRELTQGKSDVREQIDISVEEEPVAFDPDQPWSIMRGPNQWPAQVPGLRTVAESWLGHGERIARVLFTEWLAALGQPDSLLDEAFSPADQRLKIVRYPEVAAGEHSQGVGSHKDAGLLTLLFVEPGKKGLQVDKDGTWVDARPVDGALVVNIGEMLEQATDGYLKATRHRVVSPAAGQGDRISVPYFFGPSLSAHFPAWPLPPELAAKARGVEVEEHNQIHADYGLNVLKAWLRSHPPVTERHHPRLAEQLGI